MRANIAVVAIVASDGFGLRARRLRMHHLGGSASLAYEADVVLLMNEKFDIVSRSQMTHDLTAAEKLQEPGRVHRREEPRRRRHGRHPVPQSRYEYLRLDPNGETVNERLIDERLITE